ncbi:MAG TPA: hypothetical protein VFI65_18055 [Streptosporangiaceae bacterium]|nr:hypothetical protein [Streptosporangiaceae bacterium]
MAPLADPIQEAKRLIGLAASRDLVLRALGGVAICLQSPDGHPRLARTVKDIDLAAAKGSHKRAIKVVLEAGYQADEMFNALRGSRRLLFGDPSNGRHLDVFVGEFSMCHDLPLTARLGRDPLTVPKEELLLSKLQIVELTENDQSDIHNLLFHNDVLVSGEGGISAAFVAGLCASDWGLWRTCQLNLERSLANLAKSELEPDERALVTARIETLRDRIDAEPKPLKWRMRNQVGDRVRWYNEPEEEAQGT